MPKKSFIIILAVCVAIMPFLGFPRLWEDSFYVGAGVFILLLSIDLNFLRKKKVRPMRPTRKGQQNVESDVYVESIPSKITNGTMN